MPGVLPHWTLKPQLKDKSEPGGRKEHKVQSQCIFSYFTNCKHRGNCIVLSHRCDVRGLEGGKGALKICNNDMT